MHVLSNGLFLGCSYHVGYSPCMRTPYEPVGRVTCKNSWEETSGHLSSQTIPIHHHDDEPYNQHKALALNHQRGSMTNDRRPPSTSD